MALVAALVYVPTLGSYFLADDFGLHMTRVDGSDPRSYLLSHSGHLRPIPLHSMRAEYALFGLSPIPAHAVNVVLHVACTLLTGLLALQLTRDRAVALAAALLFGLHPVHPPAVSWISARFDLFCTLFSLGCLVTYHAHRESGRRWPLVASAGLFVLALFSKEEAFSLLPILFAYELSIRRRWFARALLPFALLLIAYFVLRTVLIGGLGGMMHPDGSSKHLNTTVVLLLRGLFIAPLRPLLLPFNTDWWGRGALPLQVILGTALTAWVALAAGKRDPGFPRACAFGAALLILATLPFASLVTRGFPGDLVNARFLYLPSVGFCLMLGAFSGPTLRRLSGRVVFGAIVALYAAVTLGNNGPWRAAGRLTERLVTQAQDMYGDLTRRDILVIEDVPVTYRGAYVWIRGSALIHALHATLPGTPRVAQVEGQNWGRYVDLRSFHRPSSCYSARWDWDSEELVDQTEDYRSWVETATSTASDIAWSGEELLEWLGPASNGRLGEDGRLVVPLVGDRSVVLQSPPLPPSTATIEIELELELAVSSQLPNRIAFAAWRTDGGPWADNTSRFYLRTNGELHRYRVQTPIRRVRELGAEHMQVRVVLLPMEGDLHLRSIRTTSADGPTRLEHRRQGGTDAVVVTE